MKLYRDVIGAEERRSSGVLMRFVIRDKVAELNEELGRRIRKEVADWQSGEQTEEGIGHVATALIAAETAPILGEE